MHLDQELGPALLDQFSRRFAATDLEPRFRVDIDDKEAEWIKGLLKLLGSEFEILLFLQFCKGGRGRWRQRRTEIIHRLDDALNLGGEWLPFDVWNYRSGRRGSSQPARKHDERQNRSEPNSHNIYMATDELRVLRMDK